MHNVKALNRCEVCNLIELAQKGNDLILNL